MGGASGVGKAFLDSKFYSNASPEHRYHSEAARSVLKELLPSARTEIRGHMLSESELLRVPGYTNRPEEFHQLLRILDTRSYD